MVTIIMIAIKKKTIKMFITKNTRNKYNLRQGNKHNQHY